MQWMQLDQNGDANSWSLGEFLAQDEVRVMMLDPACTNAQAERRRLSSQAAAPAARAVGAAWGRERPAPCSCIQRL